MDIGEPIREIEVIPQHIPVPSKDGEDVQPPVPAPTPKEKEPAKHALYTNERR